MLALLFGNTPGANSMLISRSIINLSGNMAFGNVEVDETDTATLTITNPGDKPLIVSSITYPAGFSGAFSGTIAPGGSDDVTVTFAPVAETTYSGTITVNSDADGGDNTIAASGTGEVTLTPMTADYFPNTSGVGAYEFNEATDITRPPNTIGGDESEALTTTEKNNTSVNNTSSANMSLSPAYGGFRIAIPIAESNIQSLDFDGEVSCDAKGGPANMAFYLWNYTTSTYDSMSASVTSGTKANISKLLESGFSDYIDGSGNLSAIFASEAGIASQAPTLYYFRLRVNYLG